MWEIIFLKIRPHRQSSLSRVINSKLAACYFSLFTILQRIGNVAYKLQLLENVKIHSVFYVSQLKKVVADHQVATELPKGLEIEETLLEPEALLEKGSLVDKSVFREGSIDRSNPTSSMNMGNGPKPLRVYYRKKLRKKNELAKMEGPSVVLTYGNQLQVNFLGIFGKENQSHGA
ncbi:hypothetical protein GH714_022672 [Hevea brasiliensis]|uniref:Tf2-1-like SH3-like domain-containing protein n=1 Tax=Hevea brasiliensis TaxID=3981 RepID=A0A6A6M597_HEVBR|nr:hypothetical protein GH714_022672 [Hevea brasiliensis]